MKIQKKNDDVFGVLVSFIGHYFGRFNGGFIYEKHSFISEGQTQKSFHTIYLYIYVFHFQKYVVIYLEKVNKTKDHDNMTPSFYHHL